MSYGLEVFDEATVRKISNGLERQGLGAVLDMLKLVLWVT